MSLAALLFDVDGTLADTEPDGHRPSYNDAFAEFGLDWHWSRELYRTLLLTPGGRERLRHYLQAYEPALGQHDERVQADREQWISELHRRKSRHFRARIERGALTLRPGVARLMDQARAEGLSVAIVTNASRASLEPILEHVLGAELLAGLALTVCGDEVTRKKPAPDLYRLACERLGCSPRDCVAIEDSAVGLAASHAAGVATIVTVNSDTRDQDFTQARAVVSDLGESCAPAGILKSPGFDFDYVDLDVLRRVCAEAGEDGR